MSNNFFKFKQFTIYQESCAMKVCTDACLFGAVIANEIKNSSVKNILDIGAGTGLQSLMLAQKINANIDAVEIDVDAFNQAKKNIFISPWHKKINIFNQDILNFTSSYKYDFIISNPPFFEGDLKSNNEKKNFAKHEKALSLKNLLFKIDVLLHDDGFFAILIPYQRSTYFELQSHYYNFFVAKKIKIKHTKNHNYFRLIFIVSRKKCTTTEQEIIIKTEDGNYSLLFSNMLQDYYL